MGFTLKTIFRSASAEAPGFPPIHTGKTRRIPCELGKQQYNVIYWDLLSADGRRGILFAVGAEGVKTAC